LVKSQSENQLINRIYYCLLSSRLERKTINSFCNAIAQSPDFITRPMTS